MTSLQKNLKQIPGNAGYYVTLASVAGAQPTFYYNAGTDAAPLISTNMACLSSNVSTFLKAPGAIFRDHGKTLLSSGRVFRKVQLMVSTNTVVNGGTDGVSGPAYASTNNPGYFTGYIELPGQGGSSSGFLGTPVARLG
jgi:hypothetical protein